MNDVICYIWGRKMSIYEIQNSRIKKVDAFRNKNTQYIGLFAGSNLIEALYRAVNCGDSGI